MTIQHVSLSISVSKDGYDWMKLKDFLRDTLQLSQDDVYKVDVKDSFAFFNTDDRSQSQGFRVLSQTSNKMAVLSTLKSQRKRVEIAIAEVAAVVDLVAVAMAEAEEDETTVLKILDQDLKAEDVEATTTRLEDLRDVHQTLNQVVGAIFQEQEKAVENKPLC